MVKQSKINVKIPAAETKAGNEISQFSFQHFRVQVFVLILIGFVFYINTFSHEAAFDDRMAITANEYVQQGISGIPDILTKDAYQSYLEMKNGSNQLSGGRYRPLSLITFAVEQQMIGVAPDNESTDEKEVRIAAQMHSRHVVNVLLYIISLIVLLYLLRNIVIPDHPIAAFIATLIFAIHPIHTEVVANVKSRDEILSVFFITLTFIKAYRYKETRRMRDIMLACVCFFLALLSKEYAVTMIGLLPLAFYLFKNEPLGYSIKTTWPYLIPLGLYLLLRCNAVSGPAEGAESNIMNNPYLYATIEQKFATQILVLLEYLKLLIFPSVLAADYSFAQIPYTDLSNPAVYLSIAIYTGLIITMVALLNKRNVLGFAIAIYLFNLALVSNLLFNIGAPMGERLIYHSSIGFAIAAGFLLYQGFRQMNIARISKHGLTGFMIILIAVSAFTTIKRNEDWKNDKTLFLADVVKVPNSVLVNNNAAAACMSYAKENAASAEVRNEWFRKAIMYFDKAISIHPRYMQSYLNRGLSYYNMGRPEKALQDWDTVRKYEPNYENVQKYLGIAGKYFFVTGMKYRETGKPDSAIHALKKSTEALPDEPQVWYALAATYYSMGYRDEARKAIQPILILDPDNADANKFLNELDNKN